MTLPDKEEVPKTHRYYQLWCRVREALFAVPNYFDTTTVIEGIPATDIFTLNSVLGATIEEQVVHALNEMRPIWDPEKEYQAFSFVRQSQTFPDVLLRKKTNGQDIAFGIELKGWYLLAKEGEPNYRFVANRAACAVPDLLVVVPWVLSNVLAGSPIIFPPFVESARYAADMRTHYWQNVRKSDSDKTIHFATKVAPYPKKSDQISDKPASDSGGNFGRIARYNLMDAYTSDMKKTHVRGVPVDAWLQFFKKFEKADAE